VAACVGASSLSCSNPDSGGNPVGAGTMPISLSVDGISKLYVEQAVAYTASATLATGATRPATGCTWGTDAPEVLTIDSMGRVTALMPGIATIWVDAEGLRGTRLLTVKGRLVGTWVLLTSNRRAVDPDTTFKSFTERTYEFTFTNPATGFLIEHRGRYTLTGDQYVEHVQSGTNPTLLGQTFTFTVEFVGDTYRQTGVCCGTGRGGGGGGGQGQVLDELWQRVTPW